jgi:hypothetical protein
VQRGEASRRPNLCLPPAEKEACLFPGAEALLRLRLMLSFALLWLAFAREGARRPQTVATKLSADFWETAVFLAHLLPHPSTHGFHRFHGCSMAP